MIIFLIIDKRYMRFINNRNKLMNELNLKKEKREIMK
jgi:hypothetical protein